MKNIKKEEKPDNEPVKKNTVTINITTILPYALVLVTLLILFNQYQIMQFTNTKTHTGSGSISTIVLSGKPGMILGPGLTPQGTSGIREYPTISEVATPKLTGDSVQDAINTLVPTGTPWYGKAVGVSFDDPVNALTRWGQIDGGYDERRFNTPGVTILASDLSPTAQQRYQRLIMTFTCDFCCGSPQRPTRIGQCGCSHSAAWRGIFKYFLKNYEDKYSDDQLMGEATRWKTLWYPGPVIKKVLSESSSGQGAVDLNSLPGMVGGC